MTTYKLPARFYNDHVYRDLPGGEVVSFTKTTVTVELDDEDYAELLSDAKFYAAMGEGEFDRSEWGIVKSARATVKALTTQGAPNA